MVTANATRLKKGKFSGRGEDVSELALNPLISVMLNAIRGCICVALNGNLCRQPPPNTD